MKSGRKEMKFDEAKCKATGKLLKAYKKDGLQYGEFEIKSELSVTEIDLNGQAAKVEPGGTVKFTIHFDGCIDGSQTVGTAKINMAIKLTGKFDMDGKAVSVEIDQNRDRTDTVKQGK
jgi:hypothetical protein